MNIGTVARGLFITAVVVVGLSAQGLDVELQRARQSEARTGNHRAAIEEYRSIHTRAGSSSPIAAMALLRMAESHAALGNPQARALFERVLQEHANESETVRAASAALAGMRSPAVRAQLLGDRPVWTGPEVDSFGQVSPDGRHITFVDWNNTGNLMVRDLVGGTSRPLTHKKSGNEPGWAGYSAISRDGKQVAYSWDEGDLTTLRVAPLRTDRRDEHETLFSGSSDVLRGIHPGAWSPDGRWIAAAIEHRDSTAQLALVSTMDGKVRVLKTLDWRGPGHLKFSPDGRYLAYTMPVSDQLDEGHVYVMAIDGDLREQSVVPFSSAVVDWAPDGRSLLFFSDRTGVTGLYRIPIAQGRAAGNPELVRANLGSVVSLGFSTEGTLYVSRTIGNRDVKTARIDLEAGTLVGSAIDYVKGFVESPGTPDWSPDARELAYRACAGQCLAIRSLATGDVRRFREQLQYVGDPRWSPDGRFLVASGRDARGRRGLFRIEAATGNVVPILFGTGLNGAQPHWMPDGATIVYMRQDRLVARNLANETEREIAAGIARAQLSPNGAHVAGSVSDPSDGSVRVIVRSMGGEQSRDVLRLASAEIVPGVPVTWTPDSRALLVARQTGTRSELWLVPVTGAPRRLDIAIDEWVSGLGLDRGFRLSPNGDRVAFLAGKNASEVWALENVRASLTPP